MAYTYALVTQLNDSNQNNLPYEYITRTIAHV